VERIRHYLKDEAAYLYEYDPVHAGRVIPVSDGAVRKQTSRLATVPCHPHFVNLISAEATP
jgi:hypothetical protein